MQSQDFSKQVLNPSVDSSAGPRLQEMILRRAFDALPDAAFLFAGDGRMVQANLASSKLAGFNPDLVTRCCQMFWYVEGADGCVVDRAIKSNERVEVEISGGAEGDKSFFIIVEPLGSDAEGSAGVLAVARDISDLRRAEAEAIAHKSFMASIADRTPDEIYALDSHGQITWMNERAEAYKLLISSGGVS